MYTMMKSVKTLDELIYELEEIRNKEGNLPVTWGDGYWAERIIEVVLLGNDNSPPPTDSPFSFCSNTRRVCVSRKIGR